MRVTADGGIDAWQRHFTDCPRVFLDDVEITGVIEADDEAGYVVRYRTGPSGRPLVLAEEFMIEKRKGRVTIDGVRCIRRR